MSLKSYTRLELAENQLKVAIALFILGQERFSVISLAGAADGILSRFVKNRGHENFTELSLRESVVKGEPTGTLQSYGKAINDTLFINQIKHMDDDDDGFIEMDPEECALGAILKAFVNYIALEGHQKDIVLGFKAWLRVNLDPKKYNIHGDPDWKASN